MSNPFKEIQENQQPSPELRKKVLGNIDALKLSLDLADLFLVKQPQILSTIFKKKKQ
ncbi:hypothetical protein FHR24_002804 [Wenyingzhuangia heitensis]|uniref:Uncharacterized protein n=1 Tax=Wenyingzhuangia heitensis TaxID=1487859 RepID=A0ABX0UBV9_9FLAO|nr:hypothetical protein [Wenyingzhuangia heitensis]NIJ46320.1 hypothetical protein [Wenyingzhuangia heitensis]